MEETNKPVRILLLTDSVALPRNYKNGSVRWEKTYYKLLQAAFPNFEFFLVGVGGATISQLYLLQNYYQLFNPSILILQSGIVDCAPRALTELEQKFFIKMHLIRFISPFTRFLRKLRNISYTSPSEFENYLTLIKQKFKGVPFITIGILPGCKEYDNIVPGISKKINLYNTILKRNSIYVDNEDFPRDGIIDDFHHVNEKGQEEFFKRLFPVIEKLVIS